eukprot:436939_1
MDTQLVIEHISDYPKDVRTVLTIGLQLYLEGKCNQCLELLQRKKKYPLVLYMMSECYIYLYQYEPAFECLITLQTDNCPFIFDKRFDLSRDKIQTTATNRLKNIWRCWLYIKSINKIQNNEWTKLYKCCLSIEPILHDFVISNLRDVALAIRFCYYTNHYKSGYEKIMKLLNMKMLGAECIGHGKYRTPYVCALLLLNMGKFREWKQFVEHFAQEGLYVLSSFMGVFYPIPEKNKTSYKVLMKLMINFHPKPGNGWIDLLCLNGDLKNIYALYGQNYHPYKKKDRCNSLEDFLFYYLGGKLIYFKVKECKIAFWLYKCALKFNKYDPVCYLDLALIMKDCGKFQKALKYLERAKSLSDVIYCVNNGPLIRNKIVKLIQNEVIGDNLMTNWLNRCSWCGIKMRSMSKCKQCKAIYYCCRKHQKLDWKTHREYCQYHSMTHAKYQLLAFFNSRCHYRVLDRI